MMSDYTACPKCGAAGRWITKEEDRLGGISYHCNQCGWLKWDEEADVETPRRRRPTGAGGIKW